MADVDIPSVLRRLNIDAKRQGPEWVALCPNPDHEDKRPGWRIRDQPGSKKHGMHHCWACGFGGTLGDLVEKVLNLDWREAKEWIGSDAVAEDRPVAATTELKEWPWKRIWDGAFRLPEGVEYAPLEKWPGSARTYLLGRGITAEEVERWGIGFAVAGRLHGRVVFVKRDAEGRPLGFSARTFVGGFRRYLEPEPWERAPPSAIFGEQHWTNDRRTVYVVEGAINALAIHRVVKSIPGAHVAATSGSQLNILIASKLSTFEELVTVTDPDKAGDSLAATLGTIMSRYEKKLKRVRFAPGNDAADIPERILKEALFG